MVLFAIVSEVSPSLRTSKFSVYKQILSELSSGLERFHRRFARQAIADLIVVWPK